MGFFSPTVSLIVTYIYSFIGAISSGFAGRPFALTVNILFVIVYVSSTPGSVSFFGGSYVFALVPLVV